MKLRKFYPMYAVLDDETSDVLIKDTSGRADNWFVVETIPAGPEAMEQANLRVQKLHQEQWDRIQAAGNTLTRYQTSWYVTIDDDDVDRLCEIDHTPREKVQITKNVGVIFSAVSWTLWSDQKITKKGINFPHGNFGPLSQAAVGLINSVRGSDSGYVEGGTFSLTEVEEIIEEKSIEVGPSRGVYAREKINELVIRWRDASVSSLFEHTAGYFEGYQYDLYRSLDSLRKLISPAPGPDGISTFPGDEFDYDPELGYVHKD